MFKVPSFPLLGLDVISLLYCCLFSAIIFCNVQLPHVFFHCLAPGLFGLPTGLPNYFILTLSETQSPNDELDMMCVFVATC